MTPGWETTTKKKKEIKEHMIVFLAELYMDLCISENWFYISFFANGLGGAYCILSYFKCLDIHSNPHSLTHTHHCGLSEVQKHRHKKTGCSQCVEWLGDSDSFNLKQKIYFCSTNL